jgi:hypothetical protein
MPVAHAGGRGLEVDPVRYHRLVLHCSDSDFQRLLRFLEAPGFEVAATISPYRASARDLADLASKGAIGHKTIEIRYPAFRDMRMPPGPSGDALAAVLNVFGSSGNGTHAPSKLSYKFLVARLVDEMDISSRTAKDKLNTLLHAHHLKQDYGMILFPAHLMIDETEETEEADKSE